MLQENIPEVYKAEISRNTLLEIKNIRRINHQSVRCLLKPPSTSVCPRISTSSTKFETYGSQLPRILERDKRQGSEGEHHTYLLSIRSRIN